MGSWAPDFFRRGTMGSLGSRTGAARTVDAANGSTQAFKRLIGAWPTART